MELFQQRFQVFRRFLCGASTALGMSILLPSCGLVDGGTDSNTNWITCERQSDCDELGPDFVCVDKRCVSGDDGSGGGSASGGGSGSTSGGSAGTSSGGGTAGGNGGTSGVCPAERPTAGSPCTAPWTIDTSGPQTGPTDVIAHCSWGSDPRAGCRATAVCTNENQWEVEPSDCSTPAEICEPPPEPGSECSAESASCYGANGAQCWCSDCEGGSAYPVCRTVDPPQWACDSNPPECPPRLPNAGASCTNEGLDCGSGCDFRVLCENGIWQWRSGDCPICAAPDTPIATPDGERPIAELKVGDMVYSLHEGAIVPVPLLRVGSTPVREHRVVQLELDNGRILEISPGHPTAEGEPFAELRAGSPLGEERSVIAAKLVPYHHTRTYDILPDSSSQSYFAAGARIGSTLTAP